MLDGTVFVECDCGSDEHTLRFVLDKEANEIYTSVFLNEYRNLWQRVWVAIKYVFGYKCKHGHWDTTIITKKQALPLIKLLGEIE